MRSGCLRGEERQAMTDIRLRLEAPDGSSAKEYRIHDGMVQTRRQQPGSKYAEGSWQRLTPQQLSDHVKRSTPVSHWLQYRLGWRRLLRMCVAQEPDWTGTRAQADQYSELQAA